MSRETTTLYQPNLDHTGRVGHAFPTREWAQSNFPGAEIREVRPDAVMSARESFRDGACVVCGYHVNGVGRGFTAGRNAHFRKHVRDGSLYAFNRAAHTPTETDHAE